MGYALVVDATSEEQVAQVLGPITAKGVRPIISSGRYPLEMTDASVWRPPGEPRTADGSSWHKDPRLRRQHREAVRRSLEDFLNGHLAKLYGMVRTGWWILGDVRVRVTTCRPRPEYETKQFLRRKKPRAKKNAKRSKR